MTPPLLTVGHGTAEQDEFVDLLRGAGVQRLVDIRTAPGSRRHPHFGRDAMAGWLPDAGIGYRWEKRLGGFRKIAPDSPDTAIRNASFRGYAGYTRSPEFLAALDEVLAQAADATTAVMCSESVWWRCHRRLIADVATLAHGAEVRHLMHDGGLREHPVAEGARRATDGTVLWDGE